MKALTLLAPIALVLAGCTSYRVAYVDPVYAPRPVAVVPAPAVIAATPLADVDGDGVPDVSDRMPYDSRFR
jgi:hypothetical protein